MNNIERRPDGTWVGISEEVSRITNPPKEVLSRKQREEEDDFIPKTEFFEDTIDQKWDSSEILEVKSEQLEETRENSVKIEPGISEEIPSNSTVTNFMIPCYTVNIVPNVTQIVAKDGMSNVIYVIYV